MVVNPTNVSQGFIAEVAVSCQRTRSYNVYMYLHSGVHMYTHAHTHACMHALTHTRTHILPVLYKSLLKCIFIMLYTYMCIDQINYIMYILSWTPAVPNISITICTSNVYLPFKLIFFNQTINKHIKLIS